MAGSQGYGMSGHLGLAEEPAWSSATAATDYVEILSESLGREIDRFDVANVVGRLQEPDDQAGVNRFNGDIVFSAHPENLPWFLKGAMGVQSNTVVASGVLHKHEFTMLDSDQSSNSPGTPFTLEVNRDVNSAQQLSGVNFNSLEFNVSPNQALQVTTNVIGKDETGIAPTTPSFPGSPRGFFAFDTASVQLGGVADTNLEGMTITIDNQEEGVPALNATNQISKIRRTGSQLIRMSGVIGFEDESEFEKFRDQTEQQIILSMTKADSHEIIFDMPRVVYDSFPLGMDGRGRQIVNFTGRVRYDTGSNSSIKISVTNNTSGY